MNKITSTFGAILLILASTAHAGQDEPNAPEWRFLGPAFSHHANSNLAPETQKADSQILCLGPDGQESCWVSKSQAKHEWSEVNPSIGIERITRNTEHADRLFVSAVRDSYKAWGLMAGASRSWPILQAGRFRVEAGVGAGVWNRLVWTGTNTTNTTQLLYHYTPTGLGIIMETASVEHDPVFARRWVPFVLPVMTLTDSQSRFALNLSIMPKLTVGGRDWVPTTTFMVQLSTKFN
jgi:hypothetical protein